EGERQSGPHFARDDRRQAAVRPCSGQEGAGDFRRHGGQDETVVPRQFQDRRYRRAAGDLGEQGRLRRQDGQVQRRRQGRRGQGQGSRQLEGGDGRRRQELR